MKKRDTHLDTGFIGTPYICHVLSNNGYKDIAYKLLFKTDYPSWLYQVERGATTMWEHWDSIKIDGSFWDKGMNSFIHYAYGSVGAWMYQCIGGIDMLEAGYKKSKIAPKLLELLTYTNASLKSMYGKIAVEWKIEDDKINIRVEIPHNTSSVITLPNVQDVEKLKENIIKVYNEKKLQINISSDGPQETYADTDFKFKLLDDDSLSFEVGSGIFKFVYDYKK